MTTRCGYCAIIGPTNAGKSTLLNQILGQKVSITSRKVQTTRCRINGIDTSDDTQIIFVDTPGLFRPKRALDRAMIDEIWSVLADVDVILVLIDAAAANVPPDLTVLNGVLERRRSSQPLLLALNKCDAVHPKEKLLSLATAYQKGVGFDRVFMIAGEKGDGVGDLVQAVRALMPQGPFLYPDDQATDQSNALLCAEITREHLLDRLHQELPYSMMVETTDIEVAENGSWRIAQTIIVARDGHKGMVIGKGGATLKQIGTAARHALREILGAPVRLDLRVVVDEKWDQRIERLRAGGLYRL